MKEREHHGYKVSLYYTNQTIRVVGCLMAQSAVPTNTTSLHILLQNTLTVLLSIHCQLMTPHCIRVRAGQADSVYKGRLCVYTYIENWGGGTELPERCYLQTISYANRTVE